MEKDLQAAQFIATILDARFSFLGRRFGLNAIFDLIPGFGDGIAFFLSCYIIWIAIKYHLPTEKILQMFVNILTNFIIGFIPVIGDIGYLFFKSNLKNLEILKKYLQNQPAEGEVV